MSFDWNNYFYLATELNGEVPIIPPDLESKKRAAISRAYYAALMLAKAYLVKHENFEIQGMDSHMEIINQFNPQMWGWHRQSREVFYNLLSIKHRRVSADYDPHFMGGRYSLENETKTVLNKAKTVMRALAELERRPRRQRRY